MLTQTPTRYISGFAHKEMPGVCPVCERDIKWPVFVCDGFDADGKPTNEIAVGSGCARRLVGLPPKKGGDRATKAERDMMDAIVAARRDAFRVLIPTLPAVALDLEVGPLIMGGMRVGEPSRFGSLCWSLLESWTVAAVVARVRRLGAQLAAGQYPSLPRGYALSEVDR
jgi:hypothetical protein